MGNVMEKGGLDLSYMEVREKNKRIPFKLGVEDILGRKPHSNMPE